MIWRYKDGRGVWQIGRVEGTSDRGGTDVTYYFRSLDGVLTVRSNLAHTTDAGVLSTADPDVARERLTAYLKGTS